MQKSDSDLIFEDSFGNTLSDDKISNQFNGNLRTKLISKRDSDKQTVVNEQEIENDSGWLSRVKRGLWSFFTKSDGQVEQNLDANEVNTSHDNFDLLKDDYKIPSRRRRQSDDEEDDDEDNEIASGDHETTPDPDPVTTLLPPVKDDKYFRLKLHVGEIWNDKLKDKSSKEYKELASSLKKAIEDIYEVKSTESTTIMAQVVEVR